MVHISKIHKVLMGKLVNLFRRFISSKLPRLHKDANSHHPEDYFKYESIPYKIGYMDDYEIIRKLGHGKYSEVYEGIDIMNNIPVTIKLLRPVNKSKVTREIRILTLLQVHSNIPKLYDIIRDRLSGTPGFILEYAPNVDFRDLWKVLTDFEVKYYMYEVLKTLDYSHSKGIMHRDIKPHNIMIDHPRRKLKVIDWGLADLYVPDHKYNVRVASRYFKSPELLVGMQQYNYSLDTWSLGCVLAGIVFKKEPFFYGEDNEDQLVKIAEVLGSQALGEYLFKYRIVIDSLFEQKIGYKDKISFNDFVTVDNSELATPDAIDLISKLLVYDHIDRLLPLEAMEHHYFSDVKKMWQMIERNEEINPSAPYFCTAEILKSKNK